MGSSNHKRPQCFFSVSFKNVASDCLNSVIESSFKKKNLFHDINSGGSTVEDGHRSAERGRQFEPLFGLALRVAEPAAGRPVRAAAVARSGGVGRRRPPLAPAGVAAAAAPAALIRPRRSNGTLWP